MPRLTRTFIEKFTPTKPDHWLWDTQVPGFAVRFRGSSRTYYLKTKGKKVPIGPVETLELEEAREKAREIVAGIKLYPNCGITRPAATPNVVRLAEEHQAIHVPPLIAQSTFDLYAIYWRCHLVPFFGKKRVDEVSVADVKRFMVSKKERAVTANRCLKVLRMAFNDLRTWGGVWPRIDNPTEGVELFPETEVENMMTDEEVSRLWSVVEKRIDANELDFPARLIKLLLLTGLRSSEWRKARWDKVDLAKKTLTIPRDKAGRKRIVFLTDEVCRELAEMPVLGKWVLPNSTLDGPLPRPRTQWEAMLEEAGLPPKLRMHDIRHNYATRALFEGLTIKEVGGLLGHSNTKTTERYLHLVDDKKREAAELAGSIMSRLGSGAQLPQQAN